MPLNNKRAGNQDKSSQHTFILRVTWIIVEKVFEFQYLNVVIPPLLWRKSVPARIQLLSESIMAQYKRIEGALHNWAHSFTSIMNASEVGYFIGLISEAAKANDAPKVVLNILNGAVSPASVRTKEVEAFTSQAGWDFAKHIRKENVEPSMIRWARLELVYKFEEGLGQTGGISFADPASSPKQYYYQATVIAQDDCGSEHKATVEEWWR